MLNVKGLWHPSFTLTSFVFDLTNVANNSNNDTLYSLQATFDSTIPINMRESNTFEGMAETIAEPVIYMVNVLDPMLNNEIDSSEVAVY